jgi:uncharacterized protein YhbP (UPF0306 family)
MSAKIQPMTPELLGRVVDLLRTESTLTLSVTDNDGQPHAAAVFYVTGEGSGAAQLDLLWLSSTSSLHSVCLAQNPRAAVAIHRPTFLWREIAGVQMRGLCSVVEGVEREQALKRYRERFQLGAVLGLAIRQSTLYRFRPNWVRLTDNRAGFGWKAEFVLA